MLALAILFALRLTPGQETIQYRQPQLAARNGLIGLTFGAGNGIYFSSSRDGEQTFSPPLKVADVGALALGKHRGPRIAITSQAIVISAITGAKVSTGPHAHGLPADGDLTVWRSMDQGRTWSRSAVVNDVPGSAREGLHAMTSTANGALFAVWLDLRGNGTRLYGARSTDHGATWSKNAQIYESPDGTICQCCHPSVVMEGDQIYVMWRNVLDGNRDMYLASSGNGGQSFAAPHKLGVGTWPLNACPMDGGGLALRQGRVTTLWRRGSDLFLSSPGEPEARFATGKDATIIATEKGIYTAWSNAEGLWTRVPGHSQPVRLGSEGGFVQLLPVANSRVLAAWEQNGGISLKLLE
jgi:hypothetical protein